MNLRRLRYFVAVADELHFGRAAKRLHMAQPPLSQQIRQLEAELGVTLFERSTRRVTLTDAGRLFYPEAQRLLVEADSVERRVAEIRSGDGGTLRLGFVDSASYEVMPRLLRAHRQRWPSVEYELLSMSTDAQHESLVGRRIDLGIGRASRE
ncbi:MAG: LysR family transcriptional regulator, partial [Acidimicrobiales bacterium]